MNRTLVLKALVVAGVMAVVLGALGMVGGIVSERESYRDQAVQSIAESYAGPQTLIGPVLVQPYTQVVSTTEQGTDGKTRVTTATHEASEITFPAKLKVVGKIAPSERRHGLYRAAVYVMDTNVAASFDVPEPVVTGNVTFGEPYLALELSDVRGIIGQPTVLVNAVPMRLVQGGLVTGAMEELSPEPVDSGSLRSLSSGQDKLTATDPKARAWQANLRVRLVGAERGKKTRYDVAMEMQIAGTQKLSVGPVGDMNEIDLSSTWPSPLFAGRFLPRVPQVGPAGFHAAWSLSSLAAATQQQIITGDQNVDQMNVSLLTPIDPYKLSDRATKYGILFVVLTFGGFFLFEMMKQLPIHPVQYLLVGFGLAVFFLLLVSFSEHMPFGVAYLAAGAACIGLLSFYLSYVLRSVGRGVGFGGMLTALYAAVYGLLISEDNALILGSLLLFAVLAGVMVVTRKVDWYRSGAVMAPPPLPLAEG